MYDKKLLYVLINASHLDRYAKFSALIEHAGVLDCHLIAFKI